VKGGVAASWLSRWWNTGPRRWGPIASWRPRGRARGL